VIKISKRFLVISLILIILVSTSGCGINKDSEQTNAEKEQKLLTDAEVKDIIHKAEKTAVDVFNLALYEGISVQEKPPFEEVKLRLLEHYSEDIVNNYSDFYESNCEGWGNLAALFPFYDRKRLDMSEVTFQVIERKKDKIVVHIIEDSDFTKSELGVPFESIYTLEYINGKWLITEQELL